MNATRAVAGILLGLLTAASPSFAATIYSQSGPAGFGFDGQPDLLFGFQTTSSFKNVSVTMPLEDMDPNGPLSGVEGTFYLMNQIGPGTTVANQVAIDNVSGLTSSFAPVKVFSGLSLGPGSYFIVMVPTIASFAGGFGWTSSPEGESFAPPDVVGPGVTDLGGGGSTTLASYAPASTLCCGGLETPNNLYVTVNGDPVATPEPASIALFAAALTSLGLARRRRRT